MIQNVAYNPLNMTLIITVKAFAPFVSPRLTSMLEYQRSIAQAQNRSPYVDPIPTPFAIPLFFPNLRAFLRDLEYSSIAFSSPTNEYTVRICEITCPS